VGPGPSRGWGPCLSAFHCHLPFLPLFLSDRMDLPATGDKFLRAVHCGTCLCACLPVPPLPLITRNFGYLLLLYACLPYGRHSRTCLHHILLDGTSPGTSLITYGIFIYIYMGPPVNRMLYRTSASPFHTRLYIPARVPGEEIHHLHHHRLPTEGYLPAGYLRKLLDDGGGTGDSCLGGLWESLQREGREVCTAWDSATCLPPCRTAEHAWEETVSAGYITTYRLFSWT